MPELPELEIVRRILTDRLVGRRIEAVTVSPLGGPLIVRDLTGVGLVNALSQATIDEITRRGKFILINFTSHTYTLAVNPKLSGRLQLCPPAAKKAGPVHVTLSFHGPEQELRYIDRKKMGQLYLTEDLAQIPNFQKMGPEALEVSLAEFRQRLSTFRGEIKGILVRGRCVAGIGNAYADEILWHARLHPYRKRPTLTEPDIGRLYHAMRTTLQEATEAVGEAMGENIHLKPRDFFAVHTRGGHPCPACGTAISAITANQRITNFCRSCQPGGLFPGMEPTQTQDEPESGARSNPGQWD